MYGTEIDQQLKDVAKMAAAMVVEELRPLLEKATSPQDERQQDRIMTEPQVREALGCSVPFFKSLRLPYIPDPNVSSQRPRRRYRWSEVNKALRRMQEEPES